MYKRQGQWGTIWLTNGSTNNFINHATIKNASVGILTENSDGTTNPTLRLNNSQIHNSATVGLLARTGFVEATNTVIGSAGQASLYCNLGGQYTFRHCTFANYWSNSFRVFPTVLLDNYIDLGNNTFLTENLDANFSNCIIAGNNNIELILDKEDGADLGYSFKNCLIKFDDFNNRFSTDALYNFNEPTLFDQITFNLDPDFKDVTMGEFMIGADSGAIGVGDPTITSMFAPQDILGTMRTLAPNNKTDVGAYQNVTFDDD